MLLIHTSLECQLYAEQYRYLYVFSLHRYFVSFVLDSTIGLLVIYIGLKLTQLIVHKLKWDSLKFGEYGR